MQKNLNRIFIDQGVFMFHFKKLFLFFVLFCNLISAKDVLVIGPEHSGTRWIGCLLSLHKEIENVHHMSYPCGGNWSNVGAQYGRMKKKGIDVAVVLCCRDRTCNNLSGEKRSSYQANFEKLALNFGNLVDDATSLINEHLLTIDKKDIVIVSYESTLLQKEYVLRQTFRLLNINEETYDYEYAGIIRMGSWISVYAEGKDGNEKYINKP